MTVAGLLLAVVSTVAINGGYALQHGAAAGLPPLAVRHPIRSLASLFRHPRWLVGFIGGIAGWVLYVVALRLAALSLVQAAAAGGIGVLALGTGKLRQSETIGIAAALTGLVLLAASLGSHTASSHGNAPAVAVWMAASVLLAGIVALVLPSGVGLGTAAGVLYAAGDVGTKAAVVGGARLWFAPALLACHGLGFVALQLGFQRGRRLATAGTAVLWTNALPIAAGMALFGEHVPGGWRGGVRIAAFALVLAAAYALGRATGPPPAAAAEPSPA